MSGIAPNLRNQPWIHSAWLDSTVILAPAFLAAAAALLFPEAFGPDSDVSPAQWVALVLLVDVAHVYTTLYRTYFDARERERRSGLLLAVPLLGWMAGATIYLASPAAFWTTLAYVAVFHFVRQQYGFLMIYSRPRQGHAGESGWRRRLSQAAIYAATLYPLLWWHGHQPRQFHWFVEGDFLTVPALARMDGVLFAVYVVVLASFVLKEVTDWIRGRGFNLPRALLVSGTALAWYVGIVAIDGDLAFTATNVLAHGVPYMALIWVHGRRAARAAAPRPAVAAPWLPPGLSTATAAFAPWSGSGNGREGALSWFMARVFSARFVPVFLGLVALLAYVEEGLWAGLVWRERGEIFAPFLAALPAISDRATLACLVPLLALPQLTHYVLDGFIWKMGKGDTEWKSTLAR